MKKILSDFLTMSTTVFLTNFKDVRTFKKASFEAFFISSIFALEDNS